MYGSNLPAGFYFLVFGRKREEDELPVGYIKRASETSGQKWMELGERLKKRAFY